MKKFNIGDLVIGNDKANRYSITKCGWVGRVVDFSVMVNDDYQPLLILKDLRDELHYKKFIVDPECFDILNKEYAEEIKKQKKGLRKDPISGESCRRVIIEITDDGAKAKYINGKKIEKEARIRRYYGDKPDDCAAARYVVDALFGKSKSSLGGELEKSAEWASRTAKILGGMNWNDILFRAYVEGGKK